MMATASCPYRSNSGRLVQVRETGRVGQHETRGSDVGLVGILGVDSA
jgi:hypothetical protein